MVEQTCEKLRKYKFAIVVDIYNNGFERFFGILVVFWDPEIKE